MRLDFYNGRIVRFLRTDPINKNNENHDSIGIKIRDQEWFIQS